MAPNTWRAYRSDLADFATWVAYSGAEWRAPEVVAAYLRTLEDGGAAYATITRRLTSIHKLVAIVAIAAGDLDYEDPTKHPRVSVTLQAIRRRLSTDQDQANPLTSQRLLQVLLSIDTATVAGMRDVAVLLVGWYGALRRSELAGLRRHHLSLPASVFSGVSGGHKKSGRRAAGCFAGRGLKREASTATFRVLLNARVQREWTT